MGRDEFGWNVNSREMVIDTLNFSEQQVSHVEEELGTSMHGAFGAVNEVPDSDSSFAKTELGSDGRITLSYSGELSEGDLAQNAAIAKTLNFNINGKVGKFLADMNLWDTQLYIDFVGLVARDQLEDVEFNTSHRKSLVNAISKYEGKKQKAHTYGFPNSFDNLYQEYVETHPDNSRIVKDSVREELRNCIQRYHQARRDTITRKAAIHLEVFQDYEVTDFILPDDQDKKDVLYYMKGFEEPMMPLRDDNKKR